MELKSNEELTAKTQCLLRSQCDNIGSISVNECSESNLFGIIEPTHVYENANLTMTEYKSLLNADADKIAALGLHFSEIDKYIAQKGE